MDREARLRQALLQALLDPGPLGTRNVWHFCALLEGVDVLEKGRFDAGR